MPKKLKLKKGTSVVEGAGELKLAPMDPKKVDISMGELPKPKKAKKAEFDRSKMSKSKLAEDTAEKGLSNALKTYKGAKTSGNLEMLKKKRSEYEKVLKKQGKWKRK